MPWGGFLIWRNLAISVLIFLMLALSPSEIYAHKVTASIEGSYDYIRVTTTVSYRENLEFPEWKNRLDRLFTYSTSSRLLHETFEEELESRLNTEIQKYVPSAYVDNLDLLYGSFAFYRKPDNYTNLVITYDIHNVITKSFLGPHVVDMGFRRLTGSTEMQLGATVFDPARILHVDLTLFNASMDQWMQINFKDRIAYQLKPMAQVASKEFPPEMLIVLPPEATFSSASEDAITYYTGADIAEISALILAVIMASIATAKLSRSRFKLRRIIRVPRETSERVFWILWWASMAIIAVMVLVGIWSLMHW